jgi:hypothetical protein
MKKLVISVLVGVVVTLILGLAGGFLGGACHCMIPITLFFPFGTIIVMHTSWELLGLGITAVQFPLYAVVVANLSRTLRGAITLLLLLAVHVVAILVGLKVYGN